MFPDIIIHHRGTSQNLADIEVKKSTNPEADDWDMRKLAAFRDQLGYNETLFSRFKTGSSDVGFEWSRG